MTARSSLAVGMEITSFDPDLDASGTIADRLTDALVAGLAGVARGGQMMPGLNSSAKGQSARQPSRSLLTLHPNRETTETSTLREVSATMQLLLGRCPKCNHDVKSVRGQFYCVRCQAFLLDPGKAAPVNYRREEFPNSVFWTAERVYALLRLNNQRGRKRRPHA